MILIVDDDLETRKLYQEALELEGYQSATASTAMEARDYLTQNRLPNLILLDLSLPSTSGADFLKELRSNPTWLSVRVIVISGWDGKKTAEEIGADGFLQKPFDLTVLFATIAKILSP